jgi:hypothetical protein
MSDYIPIKKLSLIIHKNIPDCDGKKCGLGKHVNTGRYICPHNNLYIRYPDICLEWDYEKNECKPWELLPGSHRMIWWKCIKSSCGCHKWYAKIYNRTGKKSGCPYCSGRLSCKHNNLKILCPEIMLEWDYERNSKNPEEYRPYSMEVVWWKCSVGKCECHRYQMTICDKSSGQGCPFCASKRICPHYNLAVIYPDIANEWHPDKNQIGPKDVFPSSGMVVWWRCNINFKHEWEASIYYRTYKKCGCPYCSHKILTIEYNFEVMYPDIASEWHIEKNEGSPKDYFPSSHIKVWWKCKVNSEHEWEATINMRTSKLSGCPWCINKSYSKMQINWIQSIIDKEQINILHAENGGEYIITGIGKVDGFCKENNTVYEFHGDFFHGYPGKYNPDEVNPKNGKTFKELYEKTLKRDNLIRLLGFNLVVMWEHEFLELENNKYIILNNIFSGRLSRY